MKDLVGRRARVAQLGPEAPQLDEAAADRRHLRVVRVGDGSRGRLLAPFTLALPPSAFIGVAVYSAERGSGSRGTSTTCASPRTGRVTPCCPPSPSPPPPTEARLGTVAVSASAIDNVNVAGVQFKVDGRNLGAEAAAARIHRAGTPPPRPMGITR